MGLSVQVKSLPASFKWLLFRLGWKPGSTSARMADATLANLHGACSRRHDAKLIIWRAMDPEKLINGLLMYVGLVVLLTFHEFGHAWTASKCGDDTARLQGRVSLNPLVHIDLIGTVAIPLIALFLSLSGSGMGGFLIGWAKPVPVNLMNLRRRNLDDILVTLAGPAMNVVLAVILIAVIRLGYHTGLSAVLDMCLKWAGVSLFLCFFNLLPIPPLDGSRVMRVLIGMSYETYYHISRFGIIILIIVIQFKPVMSAIVSATRASMDLLLRVFGFGG